MLLAMLQALFNFMLKLSVIFGFIFMIACTVFVIVCIVHGDIKINIVRGNAEKGNEQQRTVIIIIYNDYMFNSKFKQKVDEYCKKLKISVKEALKHEYVKRLHKHYTDV